jgi:hypothetical protein
VGLTPSTAASRTLQASRGIPRDAGLPQQACPPPPRRERPRSPAGRSRRPGWAWPSGGRWRCRSAAGRRLRRASAACSARSGDAHGVRGEVGRRFVDLGPERVAGGGVRHPEVCGVERPGDPRRFPGDLEARGAGAPYVVDGGVRHRPLSEYCQPCGSHVWDPSSGHIHGHDNSDFPAPLRTQRNHEAQRTSIGPCDLPGRSRAAQVERGHRGHGRSRRCGSRTHGVARPALARRVS